MKKTILRGIGRSMTEIQTNNQEYLKYNITAIIGNGFDIGALSAIGKKAKDLPTYENFFEWLDENKFDGNLLYNEMKNGKDNGDVDWADVEIQICKLLDNNTGQQVFDDIEIIRNELLMFLDNKVNQAEINELSKKFVDSNLGSATIQRFCGDLPNDDDKVKVIKNKLQYQHHTEIKMDFLIFNYTPLVENYFTLTYEQHEPLLYHTTKNDIRMNPNLPDDPNWNGASDKLVTNFYYPHGKLYVPHSILLGGNIFTYPKDVRKNITKNSWQAS